jgi:hypothetical protein
VRLEESGQLIGNGTRDLPACSIVPKPTTLSRAPKKKLINIPMLLLWSSPIRPNDICFGFICAAIPKACYCVVLEDV